MQQVELFLKLQQVLCLTQHILVLLLKCKIWFLLIDNTIMSLEIKLKVLLKKGEYV